MIWYRHWLEIRGGLRIAAVFIALMCPLFQLIVRGGTYWYAQSGRIIRELNALAPQVTAMGPARFLPWAAHTWVCAVAAIIVGIFLAGTGIRTNGFQQGHSSMYYTLSLPTSRLELIWTRFASACGAVYVLFAAMLVVHCAILLAMRQPVPLGSMAVSSLLAGSLVIPVMAVFGILIPLWKEAGGPLYAIAIAAAFQWAWQPILRFAGSQGIPWQPIGVIILIVGAALSVASSLARTKDF